MVHDITVVYGVGMTIGSVPPDTYTNCVRNVTFYNVHFTTPAKAMYIKTNPGNSGNGIVEGITYRNLTAVFPLWFTLYYGPQQVRGWVGRGGGGGMPWGKACRAHCRCKPRADGGAGRVGAGLLVVPAGAGLPDAAARGVLQHHDAGR